MDDRVILAGIALFIIIMVLWFGVFEGWNYLKGKANIFNRFISKNPEYPDPLEEKPVSDKLTQTKPRDKDVWKHWMKR